MTWSFSQNPFAGNHYLRISKAMVMLIDYNVLVGGPDEEGSRRAMQAMLQMSKLDINELRRVYTS